MISNAEEPANAVASDSDPKSTANANTTPRKPRVKSAKTRSAKKVVSVKGRDKSRTGRKREKPAAKRRKVSKSAKILELLKRPQGATLKELMQATGWQAHSVRGFLSGMVGKKMALDVKSRKAEGEDRRYAVEA